MQGVLTREEIMSCPDEILNAVNISGVLNANPNTIRGQAAECPELLGFPVIVMGSRVKIPREPFIRYMGWRDGERPTE